MAVEKNVLEMWSQVKGSFEDMRDRIREAVSKLSNGMGIDSYVSLEATFPDRVVYLIDSYGINGGSRKYYQADWTEDTNGVVTLLNPIEVKPETIMVTFGESRELLTSIHRNPFEETYNVNMPLKLESRDGKQVYIGKVEIAQKADALNENNRLYPESVLIKAIDEVNEHISRFGPLHMDSIHRVKDGTNFRELRETVALIYSVTYHTDTKTVSLDEIRIVETMAGKDVMALLDAKAQLQVSQRGTGFSEVVKDEATQKSYERVTELHIDGWDFTAGGDASVTEAQFKFKVIEETKDMGKTVNPEFVTKDQVGVIVDEKLTKFKTDLIPEIQSGLVETLKTAGVISDEKDDSNGVITDAAKEVEKGKEKDTPADTGIEKKPDEALAKVEQVYQSKIRVLDEKTKEIDTLYQGIKEKTDRETLTVNLVTVTNEILADEVFKKYDADHIKMLRECVYPEALFGKVKVDDLVALKTEAKKMVDLEASKIDRVIATVRLANEGYPLRNTGDSATVTVITEGWAGQAFIDKLTEAALDKLKGKVSWIMPKDHPAMTKLSEVQAKFYNSGHGKILRNLSESGEEVTQADIAVRSSVIAATTIPLIWRLITALQVVNAGTMTTRIEDQPIESWLPVEITDIADAMAAVEVGESQTMPTVGMTTTNVTLVAMLRKVRSMITEEARLSAGGTPINPLATTIAGMARDLSSRIDRLMWWLHIVKAQAYGVTQKTSYQALTNVTGGSATEGTIFQAATGQHLWIPYEWVKTYDGYGGNPTACKLVKLFGTTSGNSYQAVVVREAADNNTALVYSDDYTINWPDGSITLTTAGAAKEAGNGLEAKYSYTTNGREWSLTPPTNVQLYDHLINLRQMIGQTKVLLGNRNYNPSFIAMSLENEDRIASSPMMTSAMGSVDNVINALAKVMSFAGLSPIRTSAIPEGWIIIGEPNSLIYRVQKPFAVRGPITDAASGDDYYQGTASEALEIPVAGKIGVVGIQNING